MRWTVTTSGYGLPRIVPGREAVVGEGGEEAAEGALAEEEEVASAEEEEGALVEVVEVCNKGSVCVCVATIDQSTLG